MKEKLTRLRRERQWGSYILVLAAILLTLFCLILLLAKIASFGAARIFNYAAARQDMLRGTITVESITANIHGGVTFENLSWDDPEGNPILRVPSGTLKVNPWDILRKHMVSTTLEEITLNRPVFAVRFDEDMKVDFVKQNDTKEGDRQEEKTLEDKVSNFNRNGRPLHVKLTIHNGRMESFYRQRHYIAKHVNMTGTINTRGTTKLSLTTGSFGGTAIGDGVELACEIDFKEKGLPSLITFTANGVDPASLGLGDDIHDKMTLTAQGSGPLARMEANGTVTMKELHIPALDFRNVKGDVHYSSGEVTFSDVTARVYGGTVTARGNYNIDSRAYDIYLQGEDLDSRIPSNEPRFYCLVKLDGEIHCDGDQKHLIAFGRFSSGPGFYMLVPFKGITGTFNNRWRAVDFYDVSIDTSFGIIHTDAFHIIDGHLHLGTIELVDKETGKAMNLREARNSEGPMKTIKEIQNNIDSIKEQVDGLKP
ncbi:hypothetical protein [uncultured Dialister sp.]|uniref:hypothetical protein n=1 Tax=uncultured Dialister sp. TaxID=278064 RepID=UPI0026DB341B|nr:hypothetical protein [uncultured Dialister sp.]